MSSIKLLWLDELITFHVAKLGGLRAIWSALAQGVDPNPPLTDLLVCAAMRVFGTSAVAVRVPAILAGWVTIVATYFFVRARMPAIFAAIAAFFFMCTASFDYTFESRSYALVLAF
ncbi:MAG: glycosyltransferase family 39 protein [Acidobacteriales bacterium]|nr:glycosyltransferase family 39 protein [Terriglobales bacterium]